MLIAEHAVAILDCLRGGISADGEIQEDNMFPRNNRGLKSLGGLDQQHVELFMMLHCTIGTDLGLKPSIPPHQPLI